MLTAKVGTKLNCAPQGINKKQQAIAQAAPSWPARVKQDMQQATRKTPELTHKYGRAATCGQHSCPTAKIVNSPTCQAETCTQTETFFHYFDSNFNRGGTVQVPPLDFRLQQLA